MRAFDHFDPDFGYHSAPDYYEAYDRVAFWLVWMPLGILLLTVWAMIAVLFAPIWVPIYAITWANEKWDLL